MKRILGILATVVAVSALIWVILESREGRYSSYASQPEPPAPQQSAGASLTYNFDADEPESDSQSCPWKFAQLH